MNEQLSSLQENFSAKLSTDTERVDPKANLNPPQVEAVEHLLGPILVLAGAGSGKTRVLTHRIAHLIREHKVSARNILAVTFTNKATEEMKHRLKSLLGDASSELWTGTFHSICLRILRHNAQHLGYKNDFVVYDEQDTKSLLKSIIQELKIDEEKNPIQQFSRAIDSAKNRGELPEQLSKNHTQYVSQLIAEVYDQYQRKLLAANAMDFGDLILNAVRVLKQQADVLDYYRRNLHFVLVDEFQDTNQIQYALIRLLSEPRRNLLVVGDDDQSIYAFRGATITNILNFERDFPGAKVVRLEQNYRSTSKILEAANAVIAKNKGRKPKKLWTSQEGGDPIFTLLAPSEDSEAEFVTREIANQIKSGARYQDIAILYRTNAQTRALEDALMRNQIPYRIYGGLKFYDRKEVKDILGYLRLLVNPSDDQAFQRVVNTPPRGIGAQSLQAIVAKAREEGAPFLAGAIAIAKESRPVAQFVSLMAELKEAAIKLPLGELIALVIKKSEYGPKLESMKDPTAHSRLENLKELEALGHAFQEVDDSPIILLQQFLDKITLASGGDRASSQSKNIEKHDEKPDTISLMTLHLAKGLEFPIVFLVGLEEGLIPHYRSLLDPEAIEEERRLCYVGITRAMRTLYLTRAFNRGMFSAGGSMGSAGGVRLVSRFARDLPDELCESKQQDEGSFLDGYTARFVSEEAEAWENRSSRFGKPKALVATEDGPPVNVSFAQLKKLLVPADQVSKSADPAYEGKPLAAPEELAPGIKVIHASLGKGAVVSVDGEPTDPKLTIQFDGYSEQKKLIYRFSKLVLDTD